MRNDDKSFNIFKAQGKATTYFKVVKDCKFSESILTFHYQHVTFVLNKHITEYRYYDK
jgi:hypothetical protein